MVFVKMPKWEMDMNYAMQLFYRQIWNYPNTQLRLIRTTRNEKKELYAKYQNMTNASVRSW